MIDIIYKMNFNDLYAKSAKVTIRQDVFYDNLLNVNVDNEHLYINKVYLVKF